MDISYVWEKLHGAMYSLISSSKMKDRLGSAYVTLAFLPEEDMPEIIKEDFSEIMRVVKTAKPTSTEGKIKAAVNRMTVTEANDIAKKILYMYDKVTRQMKDYSKY